MSKVIHVSGRRLHEQTESWYPEVSAAVRIITRARIDGKEHAERRPGTLLRIQRAEWCLEIKPSVQSSPQGWAVNGAAKLKLVNMASAKRALLCKLTAEGRLRLSSWFHDKAMTEEYLSATYSLLDEIASDPRAAITQRRDHCGVCGRGLTDEVSQYRGIGPECWRIWDRVTDEIERGDDWRTAAKSEMAELRRTMQRNHPDREGGDPEVFMQAREQFERLRADCRFLEQAV